MSVHPRSSWHRLALITTVSAVGVAATLAASVPTSAATRPRATSTTEITVEKNATWGSILSLSNGDTVYRLTKDSKNKSTCTGACATAWPPVVLASGQKSPLGKGVTRLGTITRANGTRQVTYEGIPLYRYAGDKKSGEVNGNLKDTWGQWWVVNPSDPTATPHRNGSTSTTAPGGVAY